MGNRELGSTEVMISRLTKKLMKRVGENYFDNPENYRDHIRLVNLIAEISITTTDYVAAEIANLPAGFRQLVERTSLVNSPRSKAQSALYHFFDIMLDAPTDQAQIYITHTVWPTVRDYITEYKHSYE